MSKPPLAQEPNVEPITLAEARLHLRLDTFGSPPSHPDDSLVEVIISAARGMAENYLNHSIANREVVLQLDDFGTDGYISLQDWPVVGIASVEYLDSTGAAQTWASNQYILDGASQPARLYPVTDFPEVQDRVNAVTVTFDAGYTDGESPNTYPMPKAIKQAILLMIGHLYENRQDVTYAQHYQLPMGSVSLLQPYRISMGL